MGSRAHTAIAAHCSRALLSARSASRRARCSTSHPRIGHHEHARTPHRPSRSKHTHHPVQRSCAARRHASSAFAVTWISATARTIASLVPSRAGRTSGFATFRSRRSSASRRSGTIGLAPTASVSSEIRPSRRPVGTHQSGLEPSFHSVYGCAATRPRLLDPTEAVALRVPSGAFTEFLYAAELRRESS